MDINDRIAFQFPDRPTEDQAGQIILLYRMAGWWNPRDNRNLLEKIFSGSHCFLIAKMEEEIVGMGRSISDGINDAYIQDVMVKDTWRGRGIGSKIVEKLASRLETDGMRWIGLIAERGTYKFYQDLGFQRMPDSVPMVGYMFFI